MNPENVTLEELAENSVAATIAAFYERGYISNDKPVRFYMKEAGVRDEKIIADWIKFFGAPDGV
jgi:hypothetical protein